MQLCCWTRSTRPSVALAALPRWTGPFRVLARTAPNACRLDTPAMSRVFPSSTSSASARACDGLTASAATRMPARRCQRLARTACSSTRRRSTAGAVRSGVPEHEVQDALRPALRAGALDRPGRGGQHAGAARQPDQPRGRHRRLRAGDRSLPPPPGAATAYRRRSGAAVAPPPIPPTGFTVEEAPPGDLGAAVVGRTSGGHTTAGGATKAPSPASPRGAFSRPTPGRLRRCAARRRHSSTPPPLRVPLAGPGGVCGTGA